MRRLARAFASPLVIVIAAFGSVMAARPGAERRTDLAAASLTVPAVRQAVAERADARIDGRHLLLDVQALSAPELEGRLTGSAGGRKARAFILERFKELKLQPLAGAYEQRFSFTEASGEQREFPEAVNVVGVVRGTSEPDSHVLVSAHYDHLGIRNGRIHHGADDNASGVAAMLAVAQWFAANPAQKSIVFIAFDGEEQGLRGSRHFVAKPPIDIRRVSAIVNMDMVGRGDKKVIYVAGTYYHPALKPAVDAAAKGRAIVVRFGHDRPGVPGMDDWTQSSDHGPFHTAGVPFLYFGVEDHSDYHQPSDTADRIPAPFFREAAELVLDTVRRLSEMRLPPRSGGPAAGAGS
jgi:hypothetical protein